MRDSIRVITGVVLFVISVFWIVENSVSAAPGDDDTITIKSVLVNPSKSQNQKIPFKTYLPKEIAPEDVLDTAGLDIDFDYQKGQYFAHKVFDLEPSERLVISIVVKDVWKINRNEIDAFKKRSEELFKQLEGTNQANKANFFKNNIDNTLGQIDRKMGSGKTLSPDEQMKQYRDIMDMLNTIQTYVAASEELTGEVGKFNSKSAWKIILTVICSLGLLSSVFFYLWYIKIKPQAAAIFTEQEAPPMKPMEAPQVEKKMAKEEKKTDISDIEKILKRKAS